mmetsp:Transcript_75183/g.119543  ORF Transcript_75183/g.119543 Transcript_75183/m.119543 type:complete len:168 (-) Transcript_75183:57-560(-)
MAKKPNLGMIIAPCVLGTFMAVCGMHDYAILHTNNSELIASYFKAKPFTIIDSVQKTMPLLLMIKILMVIYTDIGALLRRNVRKSHLMGVVFFVVLGLIVSQFLPLKQIQKKLLDGTASQNDMDRALELQARILMGNAAMLVVNIVTYIFAVADYNADTDSNKPKKD